MKRLAFVLAGALCLNVIGMAPVFAQNGSTVPFEPPPEIAGDVVTTVGPKVITPSGGTAFTGADIQVWMVLVAALVVLGAALVIAGRRRRAVAE